MQNNFIIFFFFLALVIIEMHAYCFAIYDSMIMASIESESKKIVFYRFPILGTQYYYVS